jgi:hypothetical protein
MAVGVRLVRCPRSDLGNGRAKMLTLEDAWKFLMLLKPITDYRAVRTSTVMMGTAIYVARGPVSEDRPIVTLWYRDRTANSGQVMGDVSLEESGRILVEDTEVSTLEGIVALLMHLPSPVAAAH